jgi:hypothetical protein
MAELSIPTDTVDTTLKSHSELMVKYHEALKSYDSENKESAAIVDKLVKGMDRAPTDQIDAGRRLFGGPSRFLLGVAKLEQLPPSKGVEIAFAGRSNAGKSTALNALCNQNSLARTSKTPGRTQHLNYFTEASLSAVLRNAGFEVVSVDKAGYGGSLYAIGRKRRNAARGEKASDGALDYESFSSRAEQVIASFCECSDRVLSDSKRTLGFYVPLRTLPYISRQGVYEGFRFFDDTGHWHMNVFDGVNVPIENFVGRADIIFFSVSPDASLFEVWRWPFAIRWNRFFNLI